MALPDLPSYMVGTVRPAIEQSHGGELSREVIPRSVKGSARYKILTALSGYATVVVARSRLSVGSPFRDGPDAINFHSTALVNLPPQRKG